MIKKNLGFLSLLLIFFIACQHPNTWKRPTKQIGVIVKNVEDEATHATLNLITKTTATQDIEFDTLSISRADIAYFKPYSTIILLNTSVDEFDIYTQQSIQQYIEAGGGLVNMSSTLSSSYLWPWFKTYLLPTKDSAQAIPVSDTKTHPFSQKTHGKGRLATLNTTLSSFLNSTNSEKDLQNTLVFAIGDNTFYGKEIKTQTGPDESRFTKVVLDNRDVDEPMELTVLPDGKVLYIERKGKMKCYDPQTKQTSVIAEFDVCMEGNYEDGLLGLAADPDFENNHYIYLYYSPSSDCNILNQQLSRFEMYGTDSIILESETPILEVPVQRETCCHSGGSIAFGPKGYLYLSTGDNTSSKESDGYSPMDERPGRSPFDAQKSSANTQDLRGKILRIDVQPDGTYRIPEGNLFPSDGSQGRPEIYVMGARNPFRISVDHKTGYVYWGDVGPDVAKDGKYGPESYDEFNQAKSPGNYGWPYFVGDNKAYRYRDFEVDTVGDHFNPAHPENFSPNNTGSQKLPPARGAFIWYGKSRSEEFPMLGVGSNSAMVGPVYYQDAYNPASEVCFPDYYNGKLFIYEWARSWIKAVTMDKQGNILRIEPFLSNMPLSKPIDMEFGHDGAMYLLEYGQNYFMNNPQAKLVRIEYTESNRIPIPSIATSKLEGAVPLTVEFSAAASYDYDAHDSLSFAWSIQGVDALLSGKEVSHTFEKPGIYEVSLTVKDSKGGTGTAATEIRVGNTPPEIDIAIEGNQTFFLDNSAHPYSITIRDPEDVSKGGIDPEKAEISFVFVDDGYDLEIMLADPQARIKPSMRYAKGMKLIQSSDCYTCHATDTASVGPSYREVAVRYQNDYDAISYLGNKIINGGNGNWGEKIMPGHPQHTPEETREMARYILSLDQSQLKNLPLSGEVITNQHTKSDENGVYVLSATYTDKGFESLPAISRRTILTLKHPRIQAEDYDLQHEIKQRITGPNRNITVIDCRKPGSYIAFNNIDLTDIQSVKLQLQPIAGGTISLRLDDPAGREIGQVSIPGTREKNQKLALKTFRLPWEPSGEIHKIYFVFEGKKAESLFWIDWIEFIGKTEI